jgi:hypothetical protein
MVWPNLAFLIFLNLATLGQNIKLRMKLFSDLFAIFSARLHNFSSKLLEACHLAANYG